MQNDWQTKEYNKLADTDYKMEEYIRVRKDEYDELKADLEMFENGVYFDGRVSKLED